MQGEYSPRRLKIGGIFDFLPIQGCKNLIALGLADRNVKSSFEGSQPLAMSDFHRETVRLKKLCDLVPRVHLAPGAQ